MNDGWLIGIVGALICFVIFVTVLVIAGYGATQSIIFILSQLQMLQQ
jgi:hypothetical protein